jgi:hypothetical protein
MTTLPPSTRVLIELDSAVPWIRGARGSVATRGVAGSTAIATASDTVFGGSIPMMVYVEKRRPSSIWSASQTTAFGSPVVPPV